MKKSVPFDISELHYLFNPRFNPVKSRKLLHFDSIRNEPPEKSSKPRQVVRPRKFPKIKDPTEMVCSKRKTGDLLDQLVADKVTHEILQRQKALQKMKDKDALKSWRERYRKEKLNGEPTVCIRNPPPFDIDESLLSMISRQKLTVNEKKQRTNAREKRPETDINEEIAQLRKLLESLKSERTPEEPERNMASAMREIKTIRNIQKKLEILKKRV